MAFTNRTATDFKDCLSQLIDFTTKAWAAGSVTAGTNTGTGTVYGASASESSVAETWTLTCTTGGGDGVAVFSVSGSVSGSQTDATSCDPYSIDEVSFIVLGGDTDFVAGDSFTFDIAASTAQWSTLESDLTSDQQYVLMKGVGGGSNEIFVGFRTQSDDASYFNMEVSVFSGYVDGNTYDNQPGIKSYYLCMTSVSFDFMVIMTGRHIKIIADIGAVCEHAYAGWFLPNATESQYSYPAYVGGSTYTLSTVITNTTDAHRAYWASTTSYALGAVNDGTEWIGLEESIPRSYGYFYQWYTDLNGDRTIYPCEILDEDSDSIYGRLEGVYAVSNGDSALTSYDILNTGSAGYIASQSTFNAGTYNVFVFDLLGD